MEVTLVQQALGLAITLTFCVLVATLAGALLAGVLQVVTQIQDEAISFVGKFTGLVILVYLAADYMGSELLSFTQRVWGGADFYQ